MRNSKSIRRTIVGSSAFAVAVSLAACEDNRPKAVLFESADQCMENKPEGASNWESQCVEAFEEAELEHSKIAPRYDSVSVCEDQHGVGNCNSAQSSGGSFFTPFMMGYMVSNFMNGSNNSSYTRASGRPIYSSKSSSSFFTSSGTKVGSKFASKPFSVSRSTVKTPSLAKPPKVMTKATVTRSRGFGASRSVSRSSGTRSGG